MASQTQTGKAFEFALLDAFYKNLNSLLNPVEVLRDASYEEAKSCFEMHSMGKRAKLSASAKAATTFLIDLEPGLTNGTKSLDKLLLQLAPDSLGQAGDVRDLLVIRQWQGWEIGVSAKNNHRAVKHSRLSSQIDFGKKWLDIPCSKTYFETIAPVFDYLQGLRLKDKNTRWTAIPDMHSNIYMPLLNAFREELLRIDKANPGQVPHKLVEYLVGSKDFYKVINTKTGIEIQAYNLHGKLNQVFGALQPKAKVPKLKLPSRLIEIVYENNSKTTLIVSLNEGWQISFRMHNASSKVEPSLKFDINLVSAPHTLFTHHIFVD